MSQHIHASLAMLRSATRGRWGLYFDLFCMMSIGMALRPALASASPLLLTIWESMAEMWSRGCLVRRTLSYFWASTNAAGGGGACGAGIPACAH